MNQILLIFPLAPLLPDVNVSNQSYAHKYFYFPWNQKQSSIVIHIGLVAALFSKNAPFKGYILSNNQEIFLLLKTTLLFPLISGITSQHPSTSLSHFD